MIDNVIAQIQNCAEDSGNSECLTNLPQVTADSSSLTIILSVVFGIISAVAVIIIIVQAIKFTLSSGEPDKAASARKAIIYAVVGLAISLSANAIVVLLLTDIL